MGFIEDAGFESSLPEMSCLDLTGVEVQRKRAVNSLKSTTQRMLGIRHGDVVDVIVHQAVCPDPHSLRMTTFAKQFEIDLTVCVVEEYNGFSVAALREMVGKFGNEIPPTSGHEPSSKPLDGFLKGRS